MNRAILTITNPRGKPTITKEMAVFLSRIAADNEIAYSRSDFYNEAALALLRSRGIEVEDLPKRNNSVPEKSEDKTTRDNEDNTGTK